MDREHNSSERIRTIAGTAFVTCLVAVPATIGALYAVALAGRRPPGFPPIPPPKSITVTLLPSDNFFTPAYPPTAIPPDELGLAASLVTPNPAA